MILGRQEDAQRTVAEVNGTNFQSSLLWIASVTELPKFPMQRKLSTFDKTVASRKEIFDPWRWKAGALVQFPSRNLGGPDGRRVCVGGLPWIPNQSQLDVLMGKIFDGLEMYVYRYRLALPRMRI